MSLARLSLGLAPATASLEGGTDYAFGDAETTDGERTVPIGENTSIQIDNMGQQVTNYLNTHATDPAALYVVWGGANDLFADDSAANVTATAQRETALVRRLERFTLGCGLSVGWQVAFMRVLSMDLRQRVVAACDAGGHTQAQVAARFAVPLGMVKKLLAQRRRTGDMAARYHRCKGKPKILETHRRQLRALVRKQPDLTLEQLRAASGLRCSLVAIHRALVKLGLTYKKRRCAPASRTAPTQRGRAGRGGAGSERAALTRRGWSSWTRPGPRPT